MKYIYIFFFWIGIYTAVAQEDTLYVQQAQKVKDLHQRQLKNLYMELYCQCSICDLSGRKAA